MLKAKLVVVGGESEHTEVNLHLPTIIGRGRNVNLTVPHALVSRRHTEIFERDGRLFVKDLGSLNGTFINNQRIEVEQPLDPDQLLTLGNVTFRAIYQISNGSAATDLDDPVPVPAISEQGIDDKEANESVISSIGGGADVDEPTLPAQDFGVETVDLDEIRSENDDMAEELAQNSARESSGGAINLAGEPFQNSVPGLPENHQSGLNQIADLPQLQFGKTETSSDVENLPTGSTIDFDFLDDQRAGNQDNSILGSFLKNLPR